MLRTQVKALSAATESAMCMQALLSMDSFATSDWVRYMADAAMMRTLSNLTRHRKANRLQVGIDRYVPISRHDERTVTGSRTKLPGPHLPTASDVDRYRGIRSRATPCRRLGIGSRKACILVTPLRRTSAHVRNSRYVINLAPDRRAHRHSKRCKGSGQSQGPRAICRLRCGAQCTPDGETNDHREDVNCPFARTLNDCVIATRH
jgi:hypothetical protein